jgi:hypothetical protein
MMEAGELVASIQAHFTKGGRVLLASYTRPVIYSVKHASMFRASADGRGVRIGWPGHKSVYVFLSQLSLIN